MEILDLYDIDGNKLDKTIIRGQEKPGKGEYIKLCVIYIKCGDKFLYQKCSKEKGGEYAVTGGHVPTGMDSASQILVELDEELGLTIDKAKVTLVGHIVRDTALFDIYYYNDSSLYDYDFTLQESEVESVHWFTKAEIEDLIAKGLVRKSSCAHYEKFIKDNDIY